MKKKNEAEVPELKTQSLDSSFHHRPSHTGRSHCNSACYSHTHSSSSDIIATVDCFISQCNHLIMSITEQVSENSSSEMTPVVRPHRKQHSSLEGDEDDS